MHDVHKQPLNVYDCFSPRRKNADHQHLFGNQNIGNLMACNLQIGGSLGSECEATVTDWYARTNVTGLSSDAQRVWEAWAHASTATLIVGTRPVHQQPLSDLLAPVRRSVPEPSRHSMPMSRSMADISDTCDMAILEVAMRMARQYNGGITEFWQQTGHWVRLASIAMSVLQQPVLAVIPERQNFGVRIDHEPMSQRALCEVLLTSIAPQALCWIHLAGFERRYTM